MSGEKRLDRTQEISVLRLLLRRRAAAAQNLRTFLSSRKPSDLSRLVAFSLEIEYQPTGRRGLEKLEQRIRLPSLFDRAITTASPFYLTIRCRHSVPPDLQTASPKRTSPVASFTEKPAHPRGDDCRASPTILVSVIAICRNPPQLIVSVFQRRPVLPNASRLMPL